ncbi:hypothetical protein U9M48_004931 [Paspalum notatum var. saurae]|uniref:Uncharacterized protein n=1 Tax=Paspalum notatum var. saurae TaxID=547442 RepID=A0AAQ3PVQ3_PASNO
MAPAASRCPSRPLLPSPPSESAATDPSLRCLICTSLTPVRNRYHDGFGRAVDGYRANDVLLPETDRSLQGPLGNNSG